MFIFIFLDCFFGGLFFAQGYMILLCNTDYIHMVVRFRVFLSNIDNHMASCNYFYLITVIRMISGKK